MRRSPILRIPNETLLSIFKFVEGYSGEDPANVEDWDLEYDRKDIQSCRLVCRRFCNVKTLSHPLYFHC